MPRIDNGLEIGYENEQPPGDDGYSRQIVGAPDMKREFLDRGPEDQPMQMANSFSAERYQQARTDKRIKEVESMVRELEQQAQSHNQHLREELNKSQDRERAFEAMFMLAMQVFANMFGLNMSQFSGGNVAPLFEREVQKLLVNE